MEPRGSINNQPRSECRSRRAAGPAAAPSHGLPRCAAGGRGSPGSASPATNARFDEPTPQHIFAEIEAQPPLMRPQAAKAYLGKAVDWPMTFANANEEPAGQARALFRFGPHEIKLITGNVPLSRYPQLRSMRAGERLRVRGTIRKIDTLFIELDISELVLAQPTHALADSAKEEL